MKNVFEEVNEIFKTATCLYTKQDVEKAFDNIASAMTKQLSDSNPILLCVVVGGIVTLGNLLPRLNFPLEVDYIHATRYQKNLSGKDLIWKATPSISLESRKVIIVDDILDGGLTLQSIVNFCQENKAQSVYTAVLVDKKGARLPNGLAEADFLGLTIENHYVFGYGLDYKGYLRNAPGIYRVASQYEETE